VLTQFAEPWALGHAADFFGGEPFSTILVISELPRTAEQRAQTLRRVEQAGMNHVIEFPALINDLIERVILSGSYTGSSTLQLIQLLKRYGVLRTQQLEFKFPREAPWPGANPRIDAQADADE
jgi:hypothetical protein